MLVGKPLTVTSGTESQVQVEDVTYMSGIRSVFRYPRRQGLRHSICRTLSDRTLHSSGLIL
jgi:hypothetical protein